jgi:hypothetical protein
MKASSSMRKGLGFRLDPPLDDDLTEGEPDA